MCVWCWSCQPKHNLLKSVVFVGMCVVCVRMNVCVGVCVCVCVCVVLEIWYHHICHHIDSYLMKFNLCFIVKCIERLEQTAFDEFYLREITYGFSENLISRFLQTILVKTFQFCMITTTELCDLGGIQGHISIKKMFTQEVHFFHSKILSKSIHLLK